MAMRPPSRGLVIYRCLTSFGINIQEQLSQYHRRFLRLHKTVARQTTTIACHQTPDVLWPAASLMASSQLHLYQATIER